MNRRIVLLMLPLALAASVCEAQLVRVGPLGGVSIRAPFVSVDTLPFGLGTSVRAPFTSVNTRAYAFRYGYGHPGYHAYAPYPVYRPVPVHVYHPVPVYRVHPVPVVVPVERVRYPAVSPVVYESPSTYVPSYQPGPTISANMPSAIGLRGAAEMLMDGISRRRDDADVWMDYLAPDKIIASLDANDSPDSLRGLLRNYEGVSANASLTSIRITRGFRETLQGLRRHVPAGYSDSETLSSQQSVSVDSTSDAGADEPTLAAPIKAPEDTEELPVPSPETSEI